MKTQKSKNVTSVVIGDPHLKEKKDLENLEYVQKLKETIQKHNPDFIVILGDTLDTHEKIHTQPHNIAEDLLDYITYTMNITCFLLIGNHDYINNSQFLTKNHVFGPFKKWKNMYVVDKPMTYNIKNKNFVFMPYVPPGRFIEGLNTLLKEENEMWELSDCIFAHQEFKGCKVTVNSDKNIVRKSTKGDIWDECYPLVISGHYHEEQYPAKNIKYVGSSMQHTFKDIDKKYIWFIEWYDEIDEDIIGNNEEYKITKIDLGLKFKKMITMKISEILVTNIDVFLNDNKDNICMLKLMGTPLDIKNFRKNKLYQKLTDNNVIVNFKKDQLNNAKNTHKNIVKNTDVRDVISYDDVFKKIILSKTKNVQQEYENIFKEKLSNDIIDNNKSIIVKCNVSSSESDNEVTNNTDDDVDTDNDVEDDSDKSDSI